LVGPLNISGASIYLTGSGTNFTPATGTNFLFSNAANTINNFEILDAGGVLGHTSASTTLSYLPPVYNPGGTAVASTLHMVIGSCGATTVSPCTVSLSGAAVFAATSTTFCGAADTTGVNTHTYSAYATATNQITAVDSSASFALVTFVCVGP
jgi:hypothetical protein